MDGVQAAKRRLADIRCLGDHGASQRDEVESAEQRSSFGQRVGVDPPAGADHLDVGQLAAQERAALLSGEPVGEGGAFGLFVQQLEQR